MLSKEEKKILKQHNIPYEIFPENYTFADIIDVAKKDAECHGREATFYQLLAVEEAMCEVER